MTARPSRRRRGGCWRCDWSQIDSLSASLPRQPVPSVLTRGTPGWLEEPLSRRPLVRTPLSRRDLAVDRILMVIVIREGGVDLTKGEVPGPRDFSGAHSMD